MNAMIEISRRGAILATRRADVRGVRSPALALVSVGVAFSAAVVTVQMALLAAGYDVGSTGADGKLGPKTAAAIKKYQKDQGLPVTGKVDDALKKALGVADAAAGGGAAKASAPVASISSLDSIKSDMVLPAVLFGVVVILVGVAIWALTKKGI